MSSVGVPEEKTTNNSIPGFLTKTYEIFTSPEYKYCCEWGQNGKTIIVTKIEEFSKQVLPKVNVYSFTLVLKNLRAPLLYLILFIVPL